MTGVSPVGLAVHVSEPVSVAPLAMLEMTPNVGGAAATPFVTVTELLAVAVRPSAA